MPLQDVARWLQRPYTISGDPTPRWQWYCRRAWGSDGGAAAPLFFSFFLPGMAAAQPAAVQLRLALAQQGVQLVELRVLRTARGGAVVHGHAKAC